MENLQFILNSVRQQKITKEVLLSKIKTEISTLANKSFDQAAATIPTLSREERTNFCTGYTLAVNDMFYNLANWEDSTLRLVLPEKDRILFLAWQFPELPLLFRQVYEQKALITVFQSAPWLAALESADCIVNPYSRQGLRKIEHEMAAGRLVGMTVDDIKKQRRAFPGTFFGRPVYINANFNLISLAVRHRYTIIFLAPSNGFINMTSILAEGSFSVSDAAQWINRRLEEQIIHSPQRWLMWPSMEYRFNAD